MRTHDIVRSRSLSREDPFLFVRGYESEEKSPCSWTDPGRLLGYTHRTEGLELCEVGRG